MEQKNNHLRDIKPGNGWKRIGGAVYERCDGLRIHMLGLVKLPNGTLIDESSHYQHAANIIKINGGNRKRGLMAWASELERNVADKAGG